MSIESRNFDLWYAATFGILAFPLCIFRAITNKTRQQREPQIFIQYSPNP